MRDMTDGERAAVIWGAAEERKKVVAFLIRLADEIRQGVRPRRSAHAGAVDSLRQEIENGEHIKRVEEIK